MKKDKIIIPGKFKEEDFGILRDRLSDFINIYYPDGINGQLLTFTFVYEIVNIVVESGGTKDNCINLFKECIEVMYNEPR